MASENKTIYVYSGWGIRPPEFIGCLFVNVIRGKETFSFEYNKDWIRSIDADFLFDPDLHLYEGRQFVPLNKPLFGVFSDSCPDRWGRLLMKRKEALTARKEGRKPRTLLESDYLLGVYDETRLGALRLSTAEGGPFLSADSLLPVPPWASLRSLESASLAFEDDDNSQEEKWLNVLLAPGSSLGGARPKASVRAPDGSLWIAKFPSRYDEWNTGVWEIVVRDLAAKCGLNVPEARLASLSIKGGTYLTKRFDRDGDRRIHFSSAMSLLGKTDADDSDGASYLNIVSFIKAYGASPMNDLRELWKRIVFNMAVSNTDDHLRNHGFLLSERGWILSPMFDVNPNIYGNALALNINEYDNVIDFKTAADTAEYYNIKPADAQDIISNIKKTITEKWRTLAAGYGLNANAINRMESAFDMRYK